MDITFVGRRDRFIVICLDGMTMFSHSDEEHLRHLRKTFSKCRKFDLSLNPKKYFSTMKEGKLFGHIISKDGVKVDLERVAAIDKIGLPRNKKEV